jgi:hypothetical protein
MTISGARREKDLERTSVVCTQCGRAFAWLHHPQHAAPQPRWCATCSLRRRHEQRRAWTLRRQATGERRQATEGEDGSPEAREDEEGR